MTNQTDNSAATIDITQYLRLMVQKNGSDLFLSTGTTPRMKIEGNLRPVGDLVLTSAQCRDLAFSLLDEKAKADLEKNKEVDAAIGVAKLGRFRVNVFHQRSNIGMVIRYIKSEIPSFADLSLPKTIEDLVLLPRGLVLMVGSTGSGKTTTLAAMIDHRNANTASHILTIEDPIEFLHSHKKSLVTQREVGLDTHSVENAMLNALREAPDVILIGEIRDEFTMKQAIKMSETGHLVLATLHANNANQAIDRILGLMPVDLHKQTLQDLSMNLRAVISQRLVKTKTGSRMPAVEILKQTGHVADLIRKGDISRLKEVMENDTIHGMQDFDSALFNLFLEGVISEQEALNHADSRPNLEMKLTIHDSKKYSTDGMTEQSIKTA